jgi:hypothetical protein
MPEGIGWLMWFAYIDESKDPGKFCVYTALITSGDRLASTYQKVKTFRRELSRDHGIYMAYELHAWKFAPGRGRPARRTILKDERAEIYRKILQFVVDSQAFVVVSSASTNPQYALERLVNRINKAAAVKSEHALLFFDEGEEAEIRKRLRRMSVYNPIPSKQGTWSYTGQRTRNIPLDRILEDPIFKDSRQSYFIQLADFCAYACLRMERPIPNRSKYGYDNIYEVLKPASRPFINPSDPRGMGIIRDKLK